MKKSELQYRRIWMFPRNKRKIQPWRIAQILALFYKFLKKNEWSGNKQLQKSFYKALEAANLKKAGYQYHPNPGGSRTYRSQLECLGLIFRRDDGTHWLTKAGEDIVKGKPALPILQALLLRHQYPSVYGNSRNVSIHPSIRIKPFAFVLELLTCPELEGRLTTAELVIPIIYGRSSESLSLCIDKILALRKGKSILEAVDDPAEDLCTPRSKQRTREKALKDVRDIANTCKNYLQSIALIDVQKEGRQEVIFPSQDYQGLIEEALSNRSQFIDAGQGEERFQRALGSWDRTKDTRRLLYEAEPSSMGIEESIILSRFFEYCGLNVVNEMPAEFIERMKMEHGFEPEKVETAIAPYVPKALSFFESTFLDYSKGGSSTADQFEEAVCTLFRDKFLFTAKRTGRLKREGKGGYTDIFLIALDNEHCALVDTKATPRYNLPHNDFTKMKATYIPNYAELTEGKDLKLEFCTFVAGGFSGAVEQGLKQMTRETGVAVSAISAHALLKLSQGEIQKTDQLGIRKKLSVPAVILN